MNLTAVVLVLLSAAIHVGWNFLTKSSESPMAFSLLKGTFLLAFGAVVLLSIPGQMIPQELWIYVLASGVIHGIYILALSIAYETGDISYVYPIARSAPALVPVAAFFILGETITWRGGIGIAIVMTCVLLLQFRNSGDSEGEGLRTSIRKKDTRWAFITLGAVVAYTLVDKAAMVSFSNHPEMPTSVRGPVFFLLQVMLCYLLFWGYWLIKKKLAIREVWKREWPRGLVAAAGTLASYSLILHVMQTEEVSYIVTLRQASVLLAVLVGWFILREPYGKQRLILSGAMVVGFYLVATAA
ncbi:MAG: EamA family transporter [Deltaproteobacteria bacterium]|nr:EamA family transporter [Deltaproteobacteria bacterium]MBW2071530.1 EamA family transporter [Deltaproteobacteria bacterium]